ncbi:hypothetical protein GCM10023187_12430 [Nibrella viscosa]|uniref:Uncharacterized protein n=1 Tax=Nibrella viscosa TaxID=1084524 RepID=A0ABP8K3L8_9BACT
MAYTPRPNPYMTKDGDFLPGKKAEAYAFAQEEQRRWLDSLPEAERKDAEAKMRNFHNHQNIAV